MELSPTSMKTLRIPIQLDSSLFKRFFQFMQPFHHLTEREMQVAGEYVYMRYRILKTKEIDGDEKKADAAMQKEEIRSLIRKAAGVTPAHYQVILGKLRKAKVLEGNTLNSKFMPKIVESEGVFKLLIVFDFRKEKSYDN